MSEDFYDEDTDLTQLPKPSKAAKAQKMPQELEAVVKNFTPFQRKYLELRARGMKQPDAAKKAGSEGQDRGALSRIGYGIEQIEGAKAYIQWLVEARAKVALIDEIEVVQMLRQSYKEAMYNNKFADANKAAELLGASIGMFEKGSKTSGKQAQSNAKDVIDNQAKKLEAFKDNEDGEQNQSDDKIKQLQKMIKDLNKGR